MTKTREELGLPWQIEGVYPEIINEKGDTVVDCAEICDDAFIHFIIHAANSHHALIEALEKYGTHACDCGSIVHEDDDECTCGLTALLATHPQEEVEDES